jgi:DNA polymerase III sliding clamp (beta) subunit (PCNA family)
MTSIIEPNNNQLVFVGTDSYRLAEYKIPYDGHNEIFKLIIPKTAINEIKKVADYAISKNQNNNVDINYSHNMVLF